MFFLGQILVFVRHWMLKSYRLRWMGLTLIDLAVERKLLVSRLCLSLNGLLDVGPVDFVDTVEGREGRSVVVFDQFLLEGRSQHPLQDRIGYVRFVVLIRRCRYQDHLNDQQKNKFRFM